MSEQVVIDSLDFARNGASLGGTVAVAALPRLAEVLQSDEGVLTYSLIGGMNQHGKPVLRCHVSGVLHLQCQRCLGQMEYALDAHSELLLARDEDELRQLDEHEESEVEAILADSRLDVLNLVEDEAMLDLPMVPRHAAELCQTNDAGKDKAREGSPFAVLAKLKPKQ